MLSVADELALDALLDSLNDLDRASLVRAMEDRYGVDLDEYHHTDSCDADEDEARAEGRAEGVQELAAKIKADLRGAGLKTRDLTRAIEIVDDAAAELERKAA